MISLYNKIKRDSKRKNTNRETYTKKSDLLNGSKKTKANIKTRSLLFWE